MTLSEAFAAAIKTEMGEPDVKSELAKLELSVIGGVEFLENILLRAGESAVEIATKSALGPFAAFIVPIENSLMDKGITALENLTDEEARKLLPVSAQVTIGTHTLALTVAKVWPTDLPQSPFESLPDGGGTDRNE